MGFFRSRKSRHTPVEPLPDWDDTRWRSHLRSNALGTDHHCTIYVEMITADRKEAARLFKNEDDVRARQYAESALRNKRIVAALAALSPLCNALYQRSEPLAGYTSLIQLPEPARSGIVTIIFAAGRLQLSYLTETVNFLREQFGSVHVDAIQAADGELANLVNDTVRDALSPTVPDRSDVDAELASSVKEYLGIAVAPAANPDAASALQSAPPLQPLAPGAMQTSASSADPSAQAAARRAAAVTQALSTHSSELGGPQSPQFSASSGAAAADQRPGGTSLVGASATQGRALAPSAIQPAMMAPTAPPGPSTTPPPPGMGAGMGAGMVVGTGAAVEAAGMGLKRGRTTPSRMGDVDRLPTIPRPSSISPGKTVSAVVGAPSSAVVATRQAVRSVGNVMRVAQLDDTDGSLVRRYNALRTVMAV